MKKYYASIASYASTRERRALNQGINPIQRGNESKFGDDLSQYPVSIAKVNKNADMIGKSLFGK